MLPFSPAVNVAFTVAVVPGAEARNVAQFCPAATDTFEGTVTLALLLDSETEVPPAGAFVLIVTVQLDVAGATTAAGVQLKEVTLSCCC